MAKSQKVFVTGSTGFIGTKLVNALVNLGHTVHALTRGTSNKDGLSHEGIKLMTGDIQDRASLQKGMEGCTQVYHLAAYAKNWSRDPAVFYKQNVEGMRNVFAAAKAVGAERVVFTSTIVAFGPTPPGVIGHEDMPRITDRYFTEYEETKSIAEKEALQEAANGFPVVIVNPTRVYGPGKLTEGNSVSLMIDMYDRGKVPVLLNRGKDIGNYVLVDDLVQGHILAMEKGRIGERYILGGENASLNDIFRYVDEVRGKKRFQMNLPPRIAYLYAGLEKKKAEWLGVYPQITPGWVETFLQHWAYTTAKAERELGYTIVPLKEGIRMTYEWLMQLRPSKGRR
ncbi:MAG: NAD-dependent epimerase/dehydratase family protein [Ignavibacteriales bacterium]|nr:NAD-dependent epimerase/dehydratase family protein [Ignavibacteriales bacterium]